MLALLVVLFAFPALAAPRVVASIKPVHALVAGVMAGVAQPELIVGGAASPHAYTMKPSDADRLNGAQVVFWIGPGFEGFLEKPLATLAASARTVALMDAPGVTRVGTGPDPAHMDRHVWLDPINAKVMVAAITKTLVEADPANAARYSANASVLATRLDALYLQIDSLLAPVRSEPFIVFHDAFAYYQARFRVQPIGIIAVDPERPSGARHIAQIRDRIKAAGAVCVFTEPDVEPKLMRTLMEGTKAKAGVLDPEGTALTPGPELYFTLLNNLTGNLTACLAAK